MKKLVIITTFMFLLIEAVLFTTCIKVYHYVDTTYDDNLLIFFIKPTLSVPMIIENPIQIKQLNDSHKIVLDRNDKTLTLLGAK